MFKLIVTNKTTNGVEQSDFQTQAECEAHKAHLETIGYDFTGTEETPAKFEYRIEEYKAPVADISPRQIRLALLSLGLTESLIDAAINDLESPVKEQAMIAWKYSTVFQRNVPIVETIGALLNLSSEQLNALWIAGAEL